MGNQGIESHKVVFSVNRNHVELSLIDGVHHDAGKGDAFYPLHSVAKHADVSCFFLGAPSAWNCFSEHQCDVTFLDFIQTLRTSSLYLLMWEMNCILAAFATSLIFNF